MLPHNEPFSLSLPTPFPQLAEFCKPEVINKMMTSAMGQEFEFRGKCCILVMQSERVREFLEQTRPRHECLAALQRNYT